MNRPVTTVLGIDASLTATGIAAWRDGRLSTATIRTTPEMGDHRTRRHHIAAQIAPYVTRNTLAVKEAVPLYKGKGARDNALELSALGGVIEDALLMRWVRIVIVQPTQVKQFATGSGAADKDQMVAAAREQIGVHVANDNEADALWLAAMGLHRYGRPLDPHRLPAMRARLLAKLAEQWPTDFALEAQ
ncbi:crossover junction endodeoxyribonuclease RuvC [Micromonospora sp. 4G55]|uniref:crossover junction endodeoxyribonuclease RuvC n=1 Tax=Micromonospora sp. 4G55 TaxID=2806102 RepID=UPI001A36A8CF|nr:crossover junction endodeoxyribonuclease RuvC [Micromonospora sp. 4G55]MBM0256362.1 crossover junction endodeoxyribonuclease RuvC [Micromonospora sp. 4G55]